VGLGSWDGVGGEVFLLCGFGELELQEGWLFLGRILKMV